MVALLLLAAQISADPAKALAELQRAIRADPSKESNYTDLGNLLLRTQNFKEAAIVLEHTRARFPQSAQAALSLGVAYYGQRRFDDAISAFLDAAELDPDAEQPIAFLGRVLDNAGAREEKIRDAFSVYAKRQPRSFLGHFLLGKASQSEPELRRAIALNSRCGDCFLELGAVQESKREFVEAEKSYRAAARLNPRDPVPHYRLSRVYSRLGDAEKAAAERALHEKLAAAEQAELDRRQAATRHLDLKVQP
jgi:tetratricopeptide (TPR) repeat protein